MVLNIARGLLIVFIMTHFHMAMGQELIRNGSFEGQDPFYSRIPTDWQVCDAKSTPDIQPISSDMLSHQGKTYLGLVVRVRSIDDGSYDGSNEAIHQVFVDSLQAGATYRLSFYMMYDPVHKPSIPLEVGPAKVKISLGDEPCGNFRELTTTGLVDHRFWRRYDIPFVAFCNEKTLRIETLVGNDDFALDYVMIDDVSLVMVEAATAAFDCNASEEQPDFFASDCPIWVPNIFGTASGNMNVGFKVVPSCYLLSYQIEIFDRWGNKRFESRNEGVVWDGQQCAEGVYIYRIVTEHLDDEGKHKTDLKWGEVVLIK